MIARRRGLVGQLFRRTTQLGVFAFIVWAAFGAIWRNYKVAHNSSRLVGLMEGETWANLYAANERALGLWGESYDASLDFVGMPWAATVFGIETADPIFALANVVHTGTIAPGLVGAAGIAVLIALVLGKVFCSHLCPMRFTFEIGQLCRAGLLRLGIPLPYLRPRVRLGGWVLLGGLAATVWVGVAVWHLLLPYVGLAGGVFLSITAGTTAGLLVVPAAWMAIDVLLAPGAFCHSVCPQGFLLEQLGRLRVLRLQRAAQPACPASCRACSLACPYGLSPRDRDEDPACDNCGQCVGSCPEQKLARRFVLPVVVGAAILLGVVAPAEANHNKGIPHYGYYANYPQVPTEEHIGIAGRWEMGATVFNFQGLDRRNADTPSDVKFFIYIFDLEENRNYTGPIQFTIERDGQEIARFVRDGVDEELIYATRETLPESGDYELVAHIPVGAGVEPVAIDFDIDLADDEISPWTVAGVGLPLLGMFGLAAFGRTRRGRVLLLRARMQSTRRTP